jgi:hypothetical protein
VKTIKAMPDDSSSPVVTPWIAMIAYSHRVR